MIARFFQWLLLLALLGPCSACSSFNTRWKAAEGSPTASRWEGRWKSEKHQTGTGQPEGGKLRAILEPAPDDAIKAWFRANWSLFATDYSIVFTPVPSTSRRAGGRDFRGTHELPKFVGGTYRYEAHLDPDKLTARYHSSYDQGTFDLQRVQTTKDYAPAHAGH